MIISNDNFAVLTFIDDFPYDIKSEIKLTADDVKLINKRPLTKETIQMDLLIDTL